MRERQGALELLGVRKTHFQDKSSLKLISNVMHAVQASIIDFPPTGPGVHLK